MPRQARLDAPGTLQHVMLRGMARAQIVAAGEDRETFRARLGAVALPTGSALAETRRLSAGRTQLAHHLGTRLGRPLVEAARRLHREIASPVARTGVN